MACVSRPEVVRICVELDVSQSLHNSFWLGPVGLAMSHYQEFIFDSIPTLCIL